MSIENVIYGPQTKGKLKTLAAKHNKAILGIKALELGPEKEAEMVSHIKERYVNEHGRLLDENLDMDANINFVPLTRKKKVKEEAAPDTVKTAPVADAPPAKPLTPAQKAAAAKAAKSAKADDDLAG